MGVCEPPTQPSPGGGPGRRTCPVRVAGQEGVGARAHSPGLCLKDTNRVYFLSEKSTSLPTFHFSAFSCYVNFVSFFIRTKLGKAQAIKCHEPSRHGSLSMGMGVKMPSLCCPALSRPRSCQPCLPREIMASPLALGLCCSQNWASGSP